ncbi:uncharacterized protein N7482_010513 [Penicillium canariense]|uniref:Uncharacterized protein n=1 Tax=Penicillium canariense TaxID=189055 RepID=A0A9W9HMT3_9EURO|nr:uncharacterized protein N7482_010513 [Penicillium canariense]KAJ5151261.1 hypothetical protein N7482_010513 [Penicillium canariense]
MAGPWIVEVNQCLNTTTPHNHFTIKGLSSEAVYFLQRVIPQRGLLKRPGQLPLRCNDVTSSFESNVPSGVSGYEWKSISITEYPYSGQLVWCLGQYSLPIQAYKHYVDGAKQDGLFLGAHNVSTWGLKLQYGSASSGG